jgi:hypothetical protein
MPKGSGIKDRECALHKSPLGWGVVKQLKIGWNRNEGRVSGKTPEWMLAMSQINDTTRIDANLRCALNLNLRRNKMEYGNEPAKGYESVALKPLMAQDTLVDETLKMLHAAVDSVNSEISTLRTKTVRFTVPDQDLTVPGNGFTAPESSPLVRALAELEDRIVWLVRDLKDINDRLVC